jgi:hypothetical protein
VTHEIIEGGESTAKWFCQRGGFWGTPKQLLLCARCGEHDLKRQDEPRHYRDIFKPTLHMVCDECHEALPE